MGRLARLFFCACCLFAFGCTEGGAEIAQLTPIAPTPNIVPTETLPATPIPSPTVTLFPTATATPSDGEPLSVEERRTLAQEALAVGDFDSASEQLEALITEQPTDANDAAEATVDVADEAEANGAIVETTPTEDGLEADATAPPASEQTAPDSVTLAADYTALGRIYASEYQLDEAADAFTQAVALDPTQPDTRFQLADVLFDLGDCETAIGQFEAYLAANPDMAAYVLPEIGTCHLTLGDTVTAIDVYSRTLDAPAHYLQVYGNRLTLSELLLDEERWAEAATVYQRIGEAAFTDYTQAQMLYNYGYANLIDGRTLTANGAYRQLLSDYPETDFAYLALIDLLDREVTVDEYLRGVVDYYAEAYTPAIEALGRHQSLADPPVADSYLYTALSYAALGNFEQASSALDEYAVWADAGEVAFARAELAQRFGFADAAIEAYIDYADKHTSQRATSARWEAARLAERSGRTQQAIEQYTAVVAQGDGNFSAESLWRLGWLVDGDAQVDAWQTAATDFADEEAGAASNLWLHLLHEDDGWPEVPPRALPYYTLRLNDWLDGIEPFSSQPFSLTQTTVQDQAAAEAWLKAQLDLDPATDITQMSQRLQRDPFVQRGTKLWQIGLQTEAKREVSWAVEQYADDMLASYQLSLHLRDLGLYQPSILAAQNVLRLSGTSGLTTPPFIATLVYPTYYADLILPFAEENNVDPLLMFALIRQESLFESFAASSAAAQGLGQIIPTTGEYIAGKLAWTDYELADLNKPYVNLRFAAYYLSEQLTLFEGNTAAALAAYNAGPGNALGWAATADGDYDRFVETIFFDETELYVKNIYRWYRVYQTLYGTDSSQ